MPLPQGFDRLPPKQRKGEVDKMLSHHHGRINEIKNRPLGHRSRTTDCSPPACYDMAHLKNHAKVQALNAVREHVIRKDNERLLHSMARIAVTPGPLSKQQMKQGRGLAIKSLNAVHRQRRLEEISRDNRDLLHRLVHMEPYYSNNHLKEEYAKHSKIGRHMRNCVFTPSPGSLSETAKRGLEDLNDDVDRRRADVHRRLSTRGLGSGVGTPNSSFGTSPHRANHVRPDWNSCTLVNRPATEASGHRDRADKRASTAASEGGARAIADGREHKRTERTTRSLSLASSLNDLSSEEGSLTRARSGGLKSAGGAKRGGSKHKNSLDASEPLPALHAGGDSLGSRASGSPKTPSVAETLFADDTMMMHGFVRLCRQSTKLTVVPENFGEEESLIECEHGSIDSEPEKREIFGVWGSIEVSLRMDKQIEIVALTPDHSRVTINCSTSLSIAKACRVANFWKRPPLGKPELMELALVLVPFVHVRSDFSRLHDAEGHTLVIDPDTSNLATLITTTVQAEAWNKKLPTRTLSNKQSLKMVTSILSRSGVVDVLADEANAEQQPPTDVIEEESVAGSDPADNGLMFNAHRNIPLIYLAHKTTTMMTKAASAEFPSSVFMTVVVRTGEFSDDAGEVRVSATTMQDIPHVKGTGGGLKLTLTNRLPKFALVDSEAADRFVEQLVAGLKVEINRDGGVELIATSNRACTPVTNTRDVPTKTGAASAMLRAVSFGF